MLGFIRFGQGMSRSDELNALNQNFAQLEAQSESDTKIDASKSAGSTDSGWDVIYLGNRKQYRRKLTNTGIVAGGSVAMASSLALPTGLKISDLYWSADIRVDGSYVNWIFGNISAADTDTSISYWIRNTGSGTSGAITVYLVGNE